MIFARLVSCLGLSPTVKKFDGDCPICLAEDDSRLCYVQPCGHPVHEECLLQWVVHRYHDDQTVARCVLCQTEIRAIFVQSAALVTLDPIRRWKRRALQRRFREMFMQGCFLYIFFRGNTFKGYLAPPTTVRQWKLAIIRLIRSLYEKKTVSYTIYKTAQYSMLTMSVLYVEKGRRYTICGAPLHPFHEMAVMFCQHVDLSLDATT